MDHVVSSSPLLHRANITTAARVRKVIISGLATSEGQDAGRAIERLITSSIVFGGPLESISKGSKYAAVVTFLDADDCKRFYDATPNGIDFVQGGKKRTAFVELGKDVDVVGGQLKELIDQGARRCVRAIGNDFDIKVADLKKDPQVGKVAPAEVKDTQTEKGVSQPATFSCLLKLIRAR